MGAKVISLADRRARRRIPVQVEPEQRALVPMEPAPLPPLGLIFIGAIVVAGAELLALLCGRATPATSSR